MSECEACEANCSCGDPKCDGPCSHGGCVCVGDHTDIPSWDDRHHARIRELEAERDKAVVREAALYVNLEITLDQAEKMKVALEKMTTFIERLRKGGPSNVPLPVTREARRLLEALRPATKKGGG
jgi:hypothetical protein